MSERETSARQDTQDRLVVLDQFGPNLARCKGGRIIASGYVCPHCDSYDPQNECDGKKGKRS